MASTLEETITVLFDASAGREAVQVEELEAGTPVPSGRLVSSDEEPCGFADTTNAVDMLVLEDPVGIVTV